MEPKHAPGWRGRPTSYVELRDNHRATPLEIFAIFAGVLLAAVPIAAAAIVWAAPIAAWVRSL